jgi:adenine-specific DNA glycosylase
VYWSVNSKAECLVQRRPKSGLFPDMLELPSSPWTTQPMAAAQVKLIKHSFTHFDLTLLPVRVAASKIPKAYLSKSAVRVKVDMLSSVGLPSLYKKVVRVMLSSPHKGT